MDLIMMETGDELNSLKDSALSADVQQQQQLSTMVADQDKLHARSEDE